MGNLGTSDEIRTMLDKKNLDPKLRSELERKLKTIEGNQMINK